MKRVTVQLWRQCSMLFGRSVLLADSWMCSNLAATLRKRTAAEITVNIQLLTFYRCYGRGFSLVHGGSHRAVTWLAPFCHSLSNIGHRPLVSVQLCLVVPSPSSYSCHRPVEICFRGRCIMLNLIECIELNCVDTWSHLVAETVVNSRTFLVVFLQCKLKFDLNCLLILLWHSFWFATRGIPPQKWLGRRLHWHLSLPHIIESWIGADQIIVTWSLTPVV